MKFQDFELREDLEPYHLTASREASKWAQPDYLTAIGALGNLASKARDGDGKALWVFASITCELTESLSQMLATNRAAFKGIARKMNRWPQMRSTHPLLCDPDEWLDEIELGMDVPLLLDKYSKWKPDHASDVAIQLLNYLQDMCRVDCWLKLANKKVLASKHLGSFNKSSALKWWRLAEATLKKVYPHPDTHWKLSQIATTKSRTTPGRKREQILTKVKARFVAMAPM